jgi:hypothetical protein
MILSKEEELCLLSISNFLHPIVSFPHFSEPSSETLLLCAHTYSSLTEMEQVLQKHSHTHTHTHTYVTTNTIVGLHLFISMISDMHLATVSCVLTMSTGMNINM